MGGGGGWQRAPRLCLVLLLVWQVGSTVQGSQEGAEALSCRPVGPCSFCAGGETAEEYCQLTGKKEKVECVAPKEENSIQEVEAESVQSYRSCGTPPQQKFNLFVFEAGMTLLAALALYFASKRKQQLFERHRWVLAHPSHGR
ncbi:hypothetical protein QOT17_012515 [Balamuthia mandrillaris]